MVFTKCLNFSAELHQELKKRRMNSFKLIKQQKSNTTENMGNSFKNKGSLLIGVLNFIKVFMLILINEFNNIFPSFNQWEGDIFKF